MVSKVLEHMKQTKSFDSRQQEAYLMMIRISENLQYELECLLKNHGLTQTQYNALRILRGAGVEGLPCNEIGSRMVKRVPDVTRLLDRLEKLGYVKRNRQENNRRVVIAKITDRGHDLIDGLDIPTKDYISSVFKDLDNHETEQLINLLDKLETIS